jgi:hypothetical protein
MRDSTITCDPAFAALAHELAWLERTPAHLEQLQRCADAAEDALDAIHRAVEDPDLSAAPVARRAFLEAIRLVAVLAAFPPPRHDQIDSLVRFEHTARRMLAMLEPFVPAAERALASRLIPDAPVRVRQVPRAQA